MSSVKVQRKTKGDTKITITAVKDPNGVYISKEVSDSTGKELLNLTAMMALMGKKLPATEKQTDELLAKLIHDA